MRREINCVIVRAAVSRDWPTFRGSGPQLGGLVALCGVEHEIIGIGLAHVQPRLDGHLITMESRSLIFEVLKCTTSGLL